jgi:hypothetical protein
MATVKKCPKCQSGRTSVLFECMKCGRRFCGNCGGSRYGDVCSGCNGTGRPVGKVG